MSHCTIWLKSWAKLARVMLRTVGRVHIRHVRHVSTISATSRSALSGAPAFFKSSVSRTVDACLQSSQSTTHDALIARMQQPNGLPKSRDCQSPAVVAACVSISRVAVRPSGRAPGAGGTISRVAARPSGPSGRTPADKPPRKRASVEELANSGEGFFSSAVATDALSARRCAAAAAA